jgi:aspartate 1-decarboxylase
MINLLKSKIHRAVVTQSNVNYVGSITIDSELMKFANILEYEKVSVVDVENGNRFETYVMAGEYGSGIICVNGAAARLVEVGDHVIIMAYKSMDEDNAKNHIPQIILLDENNKAYEKKGELVC